MTELRDRITKTIQKRVGNPLMRRLPVQTLLETTGRKPGQPRRAPGHDGTAHLMPDDDPRERLRSLPQFNSLAVRATDTNLLTIRVDLTN